MQKRRGRPLGAPLFLRYREFFKSLRNKKIPPPVYLDNPTLLQYIITRLIISLQSIERGIDL